MATNAWHLRSDGKAFPVYVHIYPMQDDDLASEAEVASFLIKTNSGDQDYAEYVLDAFMAMQIENSISYDADESDIDNAIYDALSRLPYKFSYPLTNEMMLNIHKSQNNFYDIDSLYDFIDDVRSDINNIWNTIKDSFNQQFCRVRFGGQFNTNANNTCIWFRIASVGYNWDNTIYKFASEMRRKLRIEYITICRDPESDNNVDDYIQSTTLSRIQTRSYENYFYKAKDGAVYYYMPIDEFFTEEHEKNPVFSSTDAGMGILYTIRQELARGNTINNAYEKVMAMTGLTSIRDYRSNLLKREYRRCISASEWMDNLNTRTKGKMLKANNLIKKQFPEILDIDVEFFERENRSGNPIGFELLYTLISNHPDIDNMQVSIVSPKSLSATPVDRIVKLFAMEYKDYLKFSNIMINENDAISDTATIKYAIYNGEKGAKRKQLSDFYINPDEAINDLLNKYPSSAQLVKISRNGEEIIM